jgi:hypothetical protein
MEVLELWRWPVTGAHGEMTPSVGMDARGVGGDHAHAVLVPGPEGWAPVSGVTAEALGRWRAAYPFAVGAVLDPGAPPYALLTSPRGRRYSWGDPRLVAALEDSLGCAVRLRRSVPAALGAPGVVRVTTIGAAGAHVLLDADASGWMPGHELSFPGGVRLRIVARESSGWVRTRVVAAGRVATGERVELAAGTGATSGGAVTGR